MACKKVRPNYTWLLTDRVTPQSECGSTKCSILKGRFILRASPVGRSRLRSSSYPRDTGGDSFRRLITAWSLETFGRKLGAKPRQILPDDV